MFFFTIPPDETGLDICTTQCYIYSSLSFNCVINLEDRNVCRNTSL